MYGKRMWTVSYTHLSLTKEDVIKGTWKDVKFVGNDFVLLQNEDDKYGVIDKDGKTVVEFGKFSKMCIRDR